jgi:tripartite-type tricarboxylate transporter receptor subunit TctC
MKYPLRLALAVAIGLSIASTAPAQTYPFKPVRLVVPFAAGGGTDITARIVGQKLTEQLRARVVIDNRPGAGGIIGTDIVAKAEPDGYSLVMVSGSHTLNPSLHRSLPYDTVKDLVPITLVVLSPGVLVVNPSIPARTVKEFIELARAKPGQIVYASAGNGTPAHLAMELLKSLTSINIIHVPYKGSGALISDLLGGQVSATIPSISSVIALIKAGKLRPLAVTSTRRSAALPDVTTMVEAGVGGYESTSWYGLLAPRGTPRAVIDRISTETARIVRIDEVRVRLIEQGLDPVGSTPREFATRIKEELVKWNRVVKASGMKVD